MNSENSKKSITFDEIAIALAKDYDCIYVIDSTDDSYVEYITEGDDRKLVIRSSGDDFYKDTVKNCHMLVYPDDQEIFLDSFKKENVTEVIRTGKSFTLNYRLVLNGKPLHYFLKTIKGLGDNVLVGVQNIDEERNREIAAEEQMLTYSRIAGVLASRYEVIYYININSNRVNRRSCSS